MVVVVLVVVVAAAGVVVVSAYARFIVLCVGLRKTAWLQGSRIGAVGTSDGHSHSECHRLSEISARRLSCQIRILGVLRHVIELEGVLSILALFG